MTMSDKPRTVSCPTCGASVSWVTESQYRPFCSARCRQIDLGAWASEAYSVPASPPDASAGEDFPPPGVERD